MAQWLGAPTATPSARGGHRGRRADHGALGAGRPAGAAVRRRVERPRHGDLDEPAWHAAAADRAQLRCRRPPAGEPGSGADVLDVPRAVGARHVLPPAAERRLRVVARLVGRGRAVPGAGDDRRRRLGVRRARRAMQRVLRLSRRDARRPVSRADRLREPRLPPGRVVGRRRRLRPRRRVPVLRPRRRRPDGDVRAEGAAHGHRRRGGARQRDQHPARARLRRRRRGVLDERLGRRGELGPPGTPGRRLVVRRLGRRLGRLRGRRRRL